MRRSLRAAWAVLAWVAATASAAEAPRTLRVDCFHTGGQGVEIFALDRVSVEPLPWQGNPARTVDSGEPGVYRYELRDVAAGNEWDGCLFVHESGHPFAGPADEYRTSPVADQAPELVLEPWEANVAALLDGQPLKQLDCVTFTRHDVPFRRVCQRALELVIDLYAAPRRPD